MCALLCAKAPAQGKQAPCTHDAYSGGPPYGRIGACFFYLLFRDAFIRAPPLAWVKGLLA